MDACCKEVLKTWLQSDLKATWGKLDDVIKEIKTASLVSTDKDGNHVFYI